MSKFSVRFSDNEEQTLDQINIHSKTAKNDKLKHLVNNYQHWMDEIKSLKAKYEKLENDRKQFNAAHRNKITADTEFNESINTLVST